MANWQNFEKAIAKLFQGFRHVRTNYGESDVDVETRDFIIECKYRSNVPKYILDWMTQAREYSTKFNKVSMLAWKSKGKRIEDSLIVMRLDDFLAVLKGEHMLNENNAPPGINKVHEFVNGVNEWLKQFKEESVNDKIPPV